MGKKSRRPNRNKPKGIPAAASPVVASSPQEETATVAALDPNQFVSEDWEGALELESEMNALVNRSEINNPSLADIINVMLGDARRCLGRERGIKEASLYYKKTIELAKKAGNNRILTKGVVGLAQAM